MGADFRALFDHADAEFLAGFGRQLLENERGAQAGGTTADDDHVDVAAGG